MQVAIAISKTTIFISILIDRSTFAVAIENKNLGHIQPFACLVYNFTQISGLKERPIDLIIYKPKINLMLLKHSFGLFLKVELKIHFAILLDSAGLRVLTD